MEFFDVVISFAREKDVPVQYISEMLKKKEVTLFISACIQCRKHSLVHHPSLLAMGAE